MSVRAVGAEGDHHVRPDAAQMIRDCLLRDLGRHRVQRTIRIAKHRDLAHAQLAGRGSQLRFTRAADDFVVRPLVAVAEEAAALTPRGGQQIRLDTVRCVLRQRAARSQRFIIGMSEDAHEPACHAAILSSLRGRAYRPRARFKRARW